MSHRDEMYRDMGDLAEIVERNHGEVQLPYVLDYFYDYCLSDNQHNFIQGLVDSDKCPPKYIEVVALATDAELLQWSERRLRSRVQNRFATASDLANLSFNYRERAETFRNFCRQMLKLPDKAIKIQ